MWSDCLLDHGTEDDHPILHKEKETAVQSLKGSKLEATTSQQNWSKQAGTEEASTALMTRSGRQENGQPLEQSPLS